MVRSHEYYEIQTALAATGQLTQSEQADLEQHTATCPACHERLAEMTELTRELFLMQASRIKIRRTPAGMQRRFLARAATAAIPLSRSTLTSLFPRGFRIAAIAVLLAFSISLSWQFLSIPDSKLRKASESSSAQTASAYLPEGTIPLLRANPHRASSHKRRFRSSSAAQHSSGSIAAPNSLPEERDSYDDLNSARFARQVAPPTFLDNQALWSNRQTSNSLAEGLLASARTSFPHRSSASCFGISEETKPEQQSCHLEIKLASLSSLGPSERMDARADRTTLKLNAPFFHFDPNPVP